MLNYVAVFLCAIFVSLLPPRYRKWWAHDTTSDFNLAAFASGILETLVSVVILVGRYLDYIHQTGPAAGAFAERAGMAGSSLAGVGLFNLAEFALQPLHILLFYFFVEGLIRVLSLQVGGECLGSLPLHAAAAIHERWELAATERRMGPRIIDEILAAKDSSHALIVRSCRPKPNWHRNITIRFRGSFYQMFKEEIESPPRPFVYYLRVCPTGHLVVVIRDYRPDDVLKPDS